MYLTSLVLSKADISALRIKDNYSIHRIVYSLFEDVRNEEEKRADVSSGILFADKGGDIKSRKILILSNRRPKLPEHGKICSKEIPAAFLMQNHYRFEVRLNPTKRDSKSRKLIPITGKEAIRDWLDKKSRQIHGFLINFNNTEIIESELVDFQKEGHRITQNNVLVVGELMVVDRSKFISTFQQGIGRGRAFGFGFLQLQSI